MTNNGIACIVINERGQPLNGMVRVETSIEEIRLLQIQGQQESRTVEKPNNRQHSQYEHNNQDVPKDVAIEICEKMGVPIYDD